MQTVHTGICLSLYSAHCTLGGTQWGAVIGGPHGVTSAAVLRRSVLFSYTLIHMPESESESRMRYTMGCCSRGSSWGNFCGRVDTICSILLYSDPHA